MQWFIQKIREAVLSVVDSWLAGSICWFALSVCFFTSSSIKFNRAEVQQQSNIGDSIKKAVFFS